MAFGFLVGVQLARGLGPAGYGVYGTAMAIIAMLMIPTELGLPQLVMREVAAARARGEAGATGAIVKWARRVVLWSSMVLLVCLFGILSSNLFQISQAVRDVLLIGLLWIPAVALGNIYGAALRGEHRIIGGQLGEVLLRPAVVSLLLAAVVWLSANSLTPGIAMGINIVGAAVGATFSILWLRKLRRNEKQATSVPASLNFGESLPIAMTEATRVLAAQVSVLVLAALASQSEVGLYRVASGVYIATTMPSTLINVACAPTISRLYAGSKIESISRLNHWISIFLATAAAGFVLLHVLFGRTVVSILFGAEYAAASSLLLILLVGEFVASLFGHPVVVLNMMRRQRAVMWWSAAALVVNLGLAVTLVRTIGYTGAAIGTAVGMVCWRAGCAVYAKRRLGLDTSWLTRVVRTRISF